MALDKRSFTDLKKSGLNEDTIKQAGFESHSASYINKAVKGSSSDKALAVDGGYSIPYHDFDGSVTQLVRFKVFGLEGCKYLSAIGAGFGIYIPPGLKALLGRNTTLVATEGEKKAEAAVQSGIPCIAIAGIDCWFDGVAQGAIKAQDPSARLNHTTPLHPTLQDLIERTGITQFIVLGDSDCGGTSTQDLKRLSRLKIFGEALRYHVPGGKVVVTTCPVFKSESKTVEKVGLDDWLLHNTVAEVKATLKASTLRASTTTKTVAVGLGAILSMQFPARELLCGGWLAKRNLALVYAARGAGKTLFTIECVIGIVTGTAVFGWPCNPTGVLYIDGEMCIAEMQSRFAAALLRANTDAIAPLRLINPELSPTMPNLSNETGQRSVDLILRETPAIKVIVIDNISTLCANGSSENDAESWSTTQIWAVGLRARGYTVIFVHHAGKGGQQRGTSRREDVLDAVVNLKLPPDHDPSEGARFECHFEKNRAFSGKDAQTQLIELVDDKWQVSPVASPYQQVIELYGNGVKQSDICRDLEMAKSTVSRMISKAKAKGDLDADF